MEQGLSGEAASTSTRPQSTAGAARAAAGTASIDTGRAGGGWAWLLLALLGGLALRLIGLERQGLWLDEGWSLWFATQADGQGILMENHPPLYYLLLAGFVKLLHSDGALRATGTLASLLSIALVWRLMRSIGGSQRAGCIAAALLALSSVDVMVARELRMYAWMTLAYGLCLCSWWAVAGADAQATRAQREPGAAANRAASQRRWALICAWLAGVVLAYLHAAGIFFACAATVFGLFLMRDWRGRATVALTGVLTALAYLPWVWLSVWQRLGVMDAGLAWRPRPGLGHVLSAPLRWFVAADPLFAAPAGSQRCARAWWPGVCDSLHLGSDVFWAGRPLLLIAALLLGVVLWAGLRSAWRAQASVVLALTAACVCPLVLLLGLTWLVAPWFDVKYLAPSMLPAACLVALMVHRATHQRLATGATVALITLMAVGGIALPSQGTMQQWREAAQALQQRWQPGDLLMIDGIGPGAELLAERYLHLPIGTPVISLRQYVPDQYRSACQRRSGDCLAQLTLPALADGASVWMLRTDLPLEKPGSFPFSADLQAWLDQRLRVEEVMPFVGIDVVRLSRRGG